MSNFFSCAVPSLSLLVSLYFFLFTTFCFFQFAAVLFFLVHYLFGLQLLVVVFFVHFFVPFQFVVVLFFLIRYLFRVSVFSSLVFFKRTTFFFLVVSRALRVYFLFGFPFWFC